jgi:HEAT repeat protein
MLDAAFEALKSYNWGADLKLLKPIDDAVVDAADDPAGAAKLEQRLAAVLTSDASRDAKDYVCRKLMLIGTAASVPTLAALVPQEENSHMARYALERLPAPEAGQALREALPKLNGKLKIGVISSLGARRDAASVSALASLLSDSDAAVSTAAATALGDIGGAEAVKALGNAKPSDAKVKTAAVDALLVSAERFLAEGKNAQALPIYKQLGGADQPKHVKLAATRGMLACAGKKS